MRLYLLNSHSSTPVLPIGYFIQVENVLELLCFSGFCFFLIGFQSTFRTSSRTSRAANAYNHQILFTEARLETFNQNKKWTFDGQGGPMRPQQKKLADGDGDLDGINKGFYEL